MATYLENLKTRRANIASRLAGLSFGDAGDKPDWQGSGGGAGHVAYKDGLYRELEYLDKQIAAAELDPDLGGEGPFEGVMEAS